MLSLIMTFKNEEGKNSSITIKYVKKDLTDAQISTTMDNIISNNIFFTTGGDLVSKVKAELVSKKVTNVLITY